MLDQAAGAVLARVLAKRGLRAEALPPDTLAAGHITALADSQAKLICLSYLGLGTGPAHIRYLVRRLRRILAEGTLILVAYQEGTGHTERVETLLDMVRADAYATMLPEAVETCVKAATGEFEAEADTPKAKAAPAKPRRKPQTTSV